MRIPKLPASVTRAMGTVKIFASKHAPGLMVGSGLVLIGTSIYFFCKATLEAQPERELHKKEMDAIRSIAQADREEGVMALDDINRREAHELHEERMQYTWTMVKVYGRPFGLAVGGTALILGGFSVINGRYVKLAGAYNVLQEGFNNYRQRVRDDQGVDKDREYLYGIKKTEVEAVVEDENGNKKKVYAEVSNPDKRLEEYSPYARFFDEYSTQWTNNPEYNLMFLNAQQSYANDKLRTRGHLFLNEVYEMLGMQHTQAGALVGWVYDKDKGKDNFVDFGIYDLHSEIKRCFVNGYEPSILLDFNVDGVIHNLI